MSYSVEICTDPTGERDRPYGAYFLFLRWRRIGEATVEGHVETDFLAHGATESEARERIGSMMLSEVRTVLEASLRARSSGERQRRWWDAMREEGGP